MYERAVGVLEQSFGCPSLPPVADRGQAVLRDFEEVSDAAHWRTRVGAAFASSAGLTKSPDMAKELPSDPAAVWNSPDDGEDCVLAHEPRRISEVLVRPDSRAVANDVASDCVSVKRSGVRAEEMSALERGVSRSAE